MLTKIKMHRIKLNLPQFQLARALGVSPSKISQLESGRFPGAATLCIKIALHYNLKVDDYFEFHVGIREMKGLAKTDV